MPVPVPVPVPVLLQIIGFDSQNWAKVTGVVLPHFI